MALAVWTLWTREVTRFLRQRSRVVGALASPLLFWFLIGSGLGRSFASDMPLSGGYLEYFYPGTLALIVLFTAIFSTISVIEDRQAGFLQGVLVAPVPRVSIVLAKVLGGTTLAVGQAALVLLLAPFVVDGLTIGAAVGALGVLALLGAALTGLGFVIAWTLDSTQGFHAIMNLLLVPMWLLSGALFPVTGAAGWVQALMTINPLTYGVSALRTTMYGVAAPGDPSLGLALAVLVAFGLVTIAASAALVERRRLA
jgi:ABC-2 type transport system permease protein